MISENLPTKNARFDIRLPLEQKILFEKAAQLGGYRNLTDFVIMTLQEKAKKIVEENEQIIASERDSRIFFNAVLNLEEPNNELLKASNEFKELLK